MKSFILSSTLLLLAICFKLKFSIVLIAYVFVLLLQTNTIKTKAITILLFLSGYWLTNHFGPLLYQMIIHQNISKGVPIITYFVMGGLPFESMPREVKSIAGEWNGYTTQLAQMTNNNSALMSQLSLQHFITQLKHIFSNPSLAFNFYLDKLIYTWTMKDYASLDMLQSFNATSNNYAALSLLSNPLLINGYIYLCNTVQFIIFISLTKACFNAFKSMDLAPLIFLLIFIGFFSYHMISESKALYVLPLIYLMLPLVSVSYPTVTLPELQTRQYHWPIMTLILVLAYLFKGITGTQHYGIEYYNYLPTY